MTTPTEPTPETPPTHVAIAGWLVPVDLVPPFAAAMRWKYPQIALSDAPDEVAVQDALLWFAVKILEEYRMDQATEAMKSAVKAVEQDYAARREGARLNVQEQAKRIVRQPPEPTPEILSTPTV